MQLPPCLIGMEACSGAHEWARRFATFGHSVKLMAPKFVAPYRKGGKNDGNDAEAICEAVARPNMRFVPIKSIEQQSDLTLHRVRQGFVEERTAMLNRIRGLLAEFGHVLPLRALKCGVAFPICWRNYLPEWPAVYAIFSSTPCGWRPRRSSMNEKSAHTFAPTRWRSEPKPDWVLVPSPPRPWSPRSATRMTSRTAGNSLRGLGSCLDNIHRRQDAPGTHTKRGDPYLRTLLVMGARAVLQGALRLMIRSRDGPALSNGAAITGPASRSRQEARIAWALLAKDLSSSR